jgi:hypothetical protein
VEEVMARLIPTVTQQISAALEIRMDLFFVCVWDIFAIQKNNHVKESLKVWVANAGVS